MIHINKIFLLLSISFIFISCGSSENSSTSPLPEGPGNPGTKWVVALYINADCYRENERMNDINEAESVDFSDGRVKVVALVDKQYTGGSGESNFADTRAFEIGYDPYGYYGSLSKDTNRIAIPDLGITDEGASVELNMGNATTLEKYVSFVLSNYKADHYLLVVTTMGKGWKSGYGTPPSTIISDETNGNDLLSASEIRIALENSGATGESKIDVIALDGNHLGMIETAYELKNVAGYMVASSEYFPSYGYPYNQIFQKMSDTIDAATPESVASLIAEQFYTVNANGKNVDGAAYIFDDVSISAIDLSKMDNVASSISSLGSAMNTTFTSCDSRLKSKYYRDDNHENSSFVDIYSFCIIEAAQYSTERNNVKVALDSALVNFKAGKKHQDSYGPTIYFPLHKGLVDVEYKSANLKFISNAPGWISFLNNFVPSTATDAHELCVTSSGGITYVGNDTIASAEKNRSKGTELFDGISVQSYIYNRYDRDFFFINDDKALNVALQVPTGCDFNLYLFDAHSYECLAKSETTSSTETISYNGMLTYGYGYYVLIRNSDDTSNSSTNHYTITYTNP